MPSKPVWVPGLGKFVRMNGTHDPPPENQHDDQPPPEPPPPPEAAAAPSPDPLPPSERKATCRSPVCEKPS